MPVPTQGDRRRLLVWPSQLWLVTSQIGNLEDFGEMTIHPLLSTKYTVKGEYHIWKAISDGLGTGDAQIA